MAVDQSLLDILCCPVTKSPLRPLDRKRVQQLDSQREAGTLQFADGTAVDAPVREALVSDDGQRIYLVDDGIPVLLEERAILAAHLAEEA